MNNFKKNWIFVLIALVSIGLGTIAVLTSLKLRQPTPVAPTVPQAKPQAAEFPQTYIQYVWINNNRYERSVPLTANDLPDFACTNSGNCPWSQAVGPGALGITGVTDTSTLQAFASTTFSTKLIQNAWFAGQGYTREVPLNGVGAPDWGCKNAGTCPWSSPLTPGDLGITGVTDSSIIHAQDWYLQGSLLVQHVWADNKRYERQIPLLTNGLPNWSCGTSCPWSAPVGPGALGITGVTDSTPLEGFSSTTLPVHVLQFAWLNGIGYTRSIPVNPDGSLNWGCKNAGTCPWTSTGSEVDLGIAGITNSNILQGVDAYTQGNSLANLCTLTFSISQPDYCLSAAITDSTLTPGQSTTVSSTANTPVNEFFYVLFNPANLDPQGTPKIICVTTGGDTTVTSGCPAGTHQLMFKDPDVTTLRLTGSRTLNYNQIFVADQNNGGQLVSSVQINAYFTLNDGPFSLPQPQCVVYANAVSAASPSPTPTPPPGTSPTPTPTPTPPAECNSTCDDNSDCPTNMICYITSGNTSGVCRIPACQTDTNCSCDLGQAQTSPTPTPSVIPTVPQAGTPWPTFFVIMGGAALLILTFALL